MMRIRHLEALHIHSTFVSLHLLRHNVVFFYGAPLEAISRVIQAKSSQAIHIPTMIMNWMTTSFWMAYGIARKDPIIYAPNAIGLLLGIAQGVLVCVYPRQPSVLDLDMDMDESNVGLVDDRSVEGQNLVL